ncbi:MAG TPA: immune inhibitor A domain-containing protein [Bacillales bacterium]|nr:immune inhibitor A domain-containing protein [Bacillales bacterium]
MKRWKKTLGVPLLSAGLIAGVFSPTAFAADGQQTVNTQTSVSSYDSGPFDIGIANHDKLLRSMIERGKIDKNASHADQEKALRKYLSNRAKNAKQRAKNDHATKKSYKTVGNGNYDKPSKLEKDAYVHGNGKKLGAKNNYVAPINKEKWDGKVRHDKILALLIQYPDFKKSDIDRSDPNITLNLPKYDKQHYQNMLFGENGYTGPKGNQLISVKQFYEQQSGGSYTVDGDVYGWYTAKHPAAYYGGNVGGSGNDKNPRSLIYEALVDAAKQGVNLSSYDQEDPNDWDHDGNTREPDGVIDHLMVIHFGIGEEAGGGKLGGDAIWSHSWNLGGLTIIPGTHSETTEARFGVDAVLGYAYTVQPQDGAAGVFAHEYGHNLGLPDEYDTIYSANSVGATTEYWTIMAAGSWGGKIPGTEPTGFSPYDKQYLQSTMPDLNWMHGVELNYNDIDQDGVTVKLDEASVKGTNSDAIRINLPDKETVVNTPKSGQYEYFSGQGDEIDKTMTTTVDLTNTSSATLDFDTWYNIEKNWDFAMVQVSADSGKTWTSLSTPNTTTEISPDGYPAIKANLPGYTGSSDGWLHQTIDLSKYAGQKIQLRFRYMTDWANNLTGFYVDNIKVTADGQKILSDNAGSDQSAFTFDGFSRNQGKQYTTQYYLLEWRNYAAADKALAHIRRGVSLMTYDPGLVVWYVDGKYTNNWVGVHPGHGFLSVVDAHQNVAYWSDGSVASSRYQVQDAAFSLNKTDKMFLDYRPLHIPGLDIFLKEKKQQAVPLFDDSRSYINPDHPYFGTILPQLGLKFRVVGQSDDMSVGAVRIYK